MDAEPPDPGCPHRGGFGQPDAAGAVRDAREVRARHDEPPHFHPETRYIVVLKGTWWVGSGPKWDRDATTPVPAGSLVVHHPNKIHYDGAKDEEVTLQIVGVGPSGTIPVDESGQPKK